MIIALPFIELTFYLSLSFRNQSLHTIYFASTNRKTLNSFWRRRFPFWGEIKPSTPVLLRSRCLITLFLAIKLWARIPLQIRDSPSALFPYLCVDFQKCRHVLVLHFKVKFDQHFVQWVLRSRLTSNLQNYIKLESSEAYLLKLEKNLS